MGPPETPRDDATRPPVCSPARATLWRPPGYSDRSGCNALVWPVCPCARVDCVRPLETSGRVPGTGSRVPDSVGLGGVWQRLAVLAAFQRKSVCNRRSFQFSQDVFSVSYSDCFQFSQDVLGALYRTHLIL